MTDTRDDEVLSFPPQAEKAALLEELKHHRAEADESIADWSPETVRMVAAMNAKLHEIFADPIERKKVQARMMEIVSPYLLACRELGQDIFGDDWEDETGIFYMGSLLHNVATRSLCTSCLLGQHPPTLHVVDEDREPAADKKP